MAQLFKHRYSYINNIIAWCQGEKKLTDLSSFKTGMTTAIVLEDSKTLLSHSSQLSRSVPTCLYQDDFHSEAPNHVILNMAVPLATTIKSSFFR